MQATETLNKSDSLREKCRGIVQDSDFQILLAAAMENMGSYKKNMTISQFPHIQSMISGGREAVDLFVYNLKTLPFRKPDQQDEPLEFVPPSELHNLT